MGRRRRWAHLPTCSHERAQTLHRELLQCVPRALDGALCLHTKPRQQLQRGGSRSRGNAQTAYTRNPATQIHAHTARHTRTMSSAPLHRSSVERPGSHPVALRPRTIVLIRFRSDVNGNTLSTWARGRGNQRTAPTHQYTPRRAAPNLVNFNRVARAERDARVAGRAAHAHPRPPIQARNAQSHALLATSNALPLSQNNLRKKRIMHQNSHTDVRRN